MPPVKFWPCCSALVLAIGLLAAGCNGDKTTSNSAVFFDADSARRDIEILTQDFGPRPAGSAANDKAADYIATEFGTSHFGVVRSNFEFEMSPNREATISIGAKSIPAVTAGRSAAGTVTGPGATLSTAATSVLTGKIAVVQRGGSTFQELVDRARTSGAAGLVIVNSEPGPFTASLPESSPFPVVTVAGSDSAPLTSAAAAGEPVTVAVSPPETVSATNLIARPVSAHGCTYAVIANYDSVSGSPGANDNASGIAVLLQLARGFGVMTSPPEVCLIAFDARANGAAGSANYFETVTASSRPAVIVAVSRVGAGNELANSGESTLRTEAARIAELLGLKYTDGGGNPPVGGDSATFATKGISTLDITRTGGKPLRDDVAKEIDVDLLKEAVQLTGELALSVSAKKRP